MSRAPSEDSLAAAGSLKALAIKSTNLVKVTAIAFAPEQAEQALQIVVAKLLQEHNSIRQPSIQLLTKEMQDYDRQIAAVGREVARLEAMVRDVDSSKSDKNFATTIVAINLLGNKKTELLELSEKRDEIKAVLELSGISATRVVGEISVEPSPYFPKLPLFLAAGGLLGLMVGIAIALYREYQQRAAHGINNAA